MSSSTEAAVLRGDTADAATSLSTPELRSGSWTRFGDRAVLGDAVTEQTLAGLAENTRAAARSQGYAVGWAEGRREAAAAATLEAAQVAARRADDDCRREEEHRAALAALEQAAARLQQTLVRLSAQVEDQVLHLARELTEAIVGHELRTTADPEADVVRRALAVLPTGLPVTVRLHPDVAASAAVEALTDVGVTVVADTGLARHDALVEADEHVVDVRVETALARVREALS